MIYAVAFGSLESGTQMSVRSRDVPSKSAPRMVLWRCKWAMGPAALGEGVPALFLATLRPGSRLRFWWPIRLVSCGWGLYRAKVGFSNNLGGCPISDATLFRFEG